MPMYEATIKTTFETVKQFDAPTLGEATKMATEFEETFAVRQDESQHTLNLEYRNISTIPWSQELVGIQHCDYFFGNEEDEAEEEEECGDPREQILFHLLEGKHRLVAESLTSVDEG